jgi:hypothetical protein
MENKLEELKSKLLSVEYELNKLNSIDQNSYTEQMRKSFRLGMVGGSGKSKNIHRLNKKRENELNRTIDNANKITDLYKKEASLKRQITYFESGQDVKDEQKKQSRNENLAKWFKSLKKGDTFQPGGNVLIIEKVNSKSIVSQGGCKWDASEVIGKAAASLL